MVSDKTHPIKWSKGMPQTRMHWRRRGVGVLMCSPTFPEDFLNSLGIPTPPMFGGL